MLNDQGTSAGGLAQLSVLGLVILFRHLLSDFKGSRVPGSQGIRWDPVDWVSGYY